eukprot:116352_1
MRNKNKKTSPLVYCILLRLKNCKIKTHIREWAGKGEPVNLEVMVDEDKQFGVAFYSDDSFHITDLDINTGIRARSVEGFHRILCFSKEELPKTITFKVDNEKPEIINYTQMELSDEGE